jgi:hypothetical protein
VTHWNRLATEIFPVEVAPIIDARAMSILHAGIHDAVNGIERRHQCREAGMSRVYGGIHFLHAVEDGWAQGRGIGRMVARMLPRAR